MNDPPAPRTFAWQPSCKRCKQQKFVGNGDASQALASRIDPLWKNPYPSRTPHETAVWLPSIEVIHWGLFAASAAPIAAALLYEHYALGFVCLALSLLFNFLPNLVIRDTRLRLYRLIGRKTRNTTIRTAADAAAPEAEESGAFVSTPGPTV